MPLDRREMGKIKMDLQAALDKDPAARNKWEIFFTYGGFKALYRHRYAKGSQPTTFLSASETE